ncbi:RNA polymerase sigma-28 factor precursor [Anaerococcus octavius]|uniref:RNA polymerase sigma-28 factor n=1 Tax=Anaerococcus octavius TaxID=54007 RepID=A0A380WV96_9FIRM|nr:sigma factor [Anaerococcus octavius]SUU92204.1 RNA polymerase sigma-28 factor precursor [Anaerococcus octavius]
MEQAISYDNNIDLFKEYQKTKSIRLRNEIALKNKKLIYIGMKGLYSSNANDIEELEQEAFICLLKAVETFDVSKGFKFSTYAISCIKAITRNRLDYSIDLSLDEPIQNQDGENLSMVDTLEDERVDIESDCVDRYNRNRFK